MKPEQLMLHYKNSRISCLRFGSGPRTAICFHGYGEDASGFRFLGQHAGNQFTFYSFDLPFHGQTTWNEGLLCTPADLLGILELLAKKESIPLAKLTIIGFSLGGRAALSLYEQAPDKIEKLVLMAPDGLKVNLWYWLATQTWAGNRFFRFTMKHPSWFFWMLKTMNKMKLVNTSIFKFVNYYIGDQKVRDNLYKRWTCLRKIKPSVSRIKSIIRSHHTAVKLIYGKFDRIILSSVGEKFKKGIENHCTLYIIHAGHQVLHEKHIAEILPVLRS